MKPDPKRLRQLQTLGEMFLTQLTEVVHDLETLPAAPIAVERGGGGGASEVPPPQAPRRRPGRAQIVLVADGQEMAALGLRATPAATVDAVRINLVKLYREKFRAILVQYAGQETRLDFDPTQSATTHRRAIDGAARWLRSRLR